MAPSRISPSPSEDPSQGLTTEQLTFFHTNGYLAIPDALSPNTTSSLLSEAYRLLSSFDLSSHPMTKFSTGETSSHVGDSYFLNSGNDVRFFFEEDAFSSTGDLTKPKEKAINKIGHYLHWLNPSYRSVSLSTANAAIAKSLGFRDPRVLQSMIICKQPEIGGRVPPHQDSTFLYTDPPSAVGFWYALEDCTVENGCLSFAAGSHKRAPVRSRFVRVTPKGAEAGKEEEATGTTFIENEGAQWPRGLEEDKEVKKEVYELVEVKAGTLVVIHGNVLHKSEKNTSLKGRMIYTFHVIEGGEKYDERNWLQPPEEGFTKLYNEAK
ncbi:hypothetical protein C1H76_7117 [Elsinoe australis]|uniref:Uncharacterized protein n=1 Tax=Elsinoe australis TaxID=40998 RepID=A0A4U7AVJ0_9PEZI|nr:hypothetical protein C1H76_7117 [Elsinoe australis]